MTRKLGYVIATIVGFSLAHWLGYRDAVADGAAVVSVGNITYGPGGGVAAVANRIVMRGNPGQPLAPFTPLLPAVPGSDPIVAVSGVGPGASAYAMLANGDFYIWDNGWTLQGNVLSGVGPTPASIKSWGSLKAKYR